MVFPSEPLYDMRLRVTFPEYVPLHGSCLSVFVGVT